MGNQTEHGESVIECTSGRTLRSDVDRKWYIAASSCGSPTGLDLKYSIVIYGWKGECSQNQNNNCRPNYSQPTQIMFVLVCLIFIQLKTFYVHSVIAQYRLCI